MTIAEHYVSQSSAENNADEKRWSAFSSHDNYSPSAAV